MEPKHVISFLDPLISHFHIGICIPSDATGVLPVRFPIILRVYTYLTQAMTYEKVPLEDFKTVFGTQIGSYDRSRLTHRPRLTDSGE